MVEAVETVRQNQKEAEIQTKIDAGNKAKEDSKVETESESKEEVKTEAEKNRN